MLSDLQGEYQEPGSSSLHGTLERQVEQGELRSPHQVKPAVPAALEAVCLKTIALRPQERYTSPRSLFLPRASGSTRTWRQRSQEGAPADFMPCLVWCVRVSTDTLLTLPANIARRLGISFREMRIVFTALAMEIQRIQDFAIHIGKALCFGTTIAFLLATGMPCTLSPPHTYVPNEARQSSFVPK